jgi:Zn-dependent protease
VSLLLFGFGLGWAKPTPVNPMNLRGGRWGEAIVAAAGPVSNLGLAVVGALGLRFLLPGADAGSVVILAFAIFVQLNLLLMVFNLVPIPPLDGSKVLYAVLDARTAFRVRPVLERYGMLILLVAVFFPVFGQRTLFEVVLGLTVTPLFHLLVGA